MSQVAYILEPYKVDPISCVMSEILKKPHITLGYEHNRQCRNVISMRPEPEQLNHALIAMIREHQPREVAVIIEGTLLHLPLLLLLDITRLSTQSHKKFGKHK